jgi:hypothetical protein
MNYQHEWRPLWAPSPLPPPPPTPSSEEEPESDTSETSRVVIIDMWDPDSEK